MAQLIGGRIIASDNPEWSEDLEGWDELRHHRVVRAPTLKLALASSGFVLGSSSSLGGQMMCVRRSAKHFKGPYWEVTAEYKGIASMKPYKRTIRTFPDKSRGTVSRVAGGVPYIQEIELNENLVGVSIHYVAYNSPPAAWVGYPAYPVSGAVAPPRPHWTGLTNPLEIIPHGWVLDGLEADELPQSRMCLVRLDYVYYQQYKPGSQSF